MRLPRLLSCIWSRLTGASDDESSAPVTTAESDVGQSKTPSLALQSRCEVDPSCCEQCFQTAETTRVKGFGGDVYTLCDGCRENMWVTFDVDSEYPPTFE